MSCSSEAQGVEDDLETCCVPAKRETGGFCAMIMFIALGGLLVLVASGVFVGVRLLA